MIKILVILILIIVLFFLSGNLWAIHYPLEFPSDEIHFSTTSDGWRIASHRLCPESPDKGRAPVILIHGLGANRHNFDGGGHYSLARYLRENGWDTWAIELRGHGLSRGIPGPSKPGGLWTGARRGARFDEFLNHDLPTAISHIRSLHRNRKVHLIGHSMGGILIAAFLQGGGASAVKSATIISSPLTFHNQPSGLIKRLTRIVKAFNWLPNIHLKVLVRPFSPLMGRFSTRVERMNMNPDNMDPWTLRSLACHGVNNVSTELITQFSEWMESGDLKDMDRGKSFSDGLKDIKTPIFLIAGGLDYLVNPDIMHFAYERVSSPKKKYRGFGKKYGDMVDYGHIDILLGKGAPKEVYPAIEEWLKG